MRFFPLVCLAREKVTDKGACEELEMLSGGGGLSKYMMANGGSDDGEDELDEQDLKDDPIYNLDLRVSSYFPRQPTL